MDVTIANSGADGVPEDFGVKVDVTSTDPEEISKPVVTA